MTTQRPLDVIDMDALRSALTRAQEVGDGILCIADDPGRQSLTGRWSKSWIWT